MAHSTLASGVGIVFNAATATAIGVIVTAIGTAVVRITVVKGKFRAQAADVLVDATVHERQLKELYKRQSEDLRAALMSVAQVLDFNDFSSEGAPARLTQANKVARRAINKKYVLGGIATDVLIDEAQGG